jgi:CheY-like chemotaxis protein
MDMFRAESYRVLLVDDNEINREIALDMLEEYGCRLWQAESGFQAVELVREHELDLILMDYLMPGMDGITATRKIRRECGENGRRPVIIALTADESDEVAERFRDSGCQDFLVKPVDEEKLNRVLERWVPSERRQHAPPSPKPRTGMTDMDMAALRIKGVDLESTGLRQKKTRAQYVELLRLFYLDGQSKLEAWRNLRDDQLSSYHIEVHGLKSASANIGALELSALAREQEFAAKDGDIVAVRAGLPELLSCYSALLCDIGAVLENESTSDTRAQRGSALRGEPLAEAIRQALSLLEDFRSKESSAAIAALLARGLPDRTRALLEQAQQKLRLYADDEAETLLRQAVAVSDDRPANG